MKYLFYLLSFLFFAPALLFAQRPQNDTLFSTYFHQRATHFRDLPQTKGDIIFLGNSITDGAEWSELFDDKKLKNRGISADVTAGILYRLDEVVKRKPAKVFLLIGTNDLARGISADSVVRNIFKIAHQLKEASPATKLYVQSILPVNASFGKFGGHMAKAAVAKDVNVQLQKAASGNGFTFIDLYPSFIDKDGRLDARYTNDGLHLTGAGYLLWKHLLYPYVYDAAAKASLIPMPQQLQWREGYFPLHGVSAIRVDDASLLPSAKWLQQELEKVGIKVPVVQSGKDQPQQIKLALRKVDVPHHAEEAYLLDVTANEVVLAANTTHGIFNGLQTWMQLCRSKVLVDAAVIKDWPAFSWRGFMTDAGRNYQSMEMLKQQIDVMSRYRFNVFHFHFTEDIAWRLAIKQYPQLTAPEHMQRDKGMYYSEQEFKELIDYCKERFIILVPEIDMPGHSAAFTRAMGFDMQSDSGLAVVKNILKEFCKTYDLPYVHIGGDEVKITNKSFMPEVSKLLHGLGKKTIGWSPGGNLDPQTLRQLWMGDDVPDSTLPYIDSRHLYVNHMDPLEAVVTLFHRQIGNAEQETSGAKGGILCVWHDRRVQQEWDMLTMNPVYSGMLAFAERAWLGGGKRGWVTNSKPGKEAEEFAAFEARLLDHKQQNFTGLHFPYTRQSQLKWNLYGPFENSGNTAKAFMPEQNPKALANKKPDFEAVGGTIVLRHWWHPVVQGVLPNAKENSTWYATTRIWADEAGDKDFWIGFNNISRSPATDSPPEGAWSALNSAVWVNGKVVPPPHWKRGGQKGHPEIPLQDEGYEYRQAAKIYLQKGWNDVLIKAPVGTFKGKDWQNPVKWMFTFVPLNP